VLVPAIGVVVLALLVSAEARRREIVGSIPVLVACTAYLGLSLATSGCMTVVLGSDAALALALLVGLVFHAGILLAIFLAVRAWTRKGAPNPRLWTIVSVSTALAGIVVYLAVNDLV